MCVVNIWPDDEFVGHFYIWIDQNIKDESFSLSLFQNDNIVFSNEPNSTNRDIILFSSKDNLRLLIRPITSGEIIANFNLTRIDIFEDHECWKCIENGFKACTN